MGTEPMAAARCSGSWSRLSLTRAEALREMSFRATSRLFLEAQKWRAVWLNEQMSVRRLGGQLCDWEGQAHLSVEVWITV